MIKLVVPNSPAIFSILTSDGFNLPCSHRLTEPLLHPSFSAIDTCKIDRPASILACASFAPSTSILCFRIDIFLLARLGCTYEFKSRTEGCTCQAVWNFYFVAPFFMLADNHPMKKLEPKKQRTLNLKPAVLKRQSKPSKARLSKSDPDYYSKIGKLSAARRALSSAVYSEMARASHLKRPKSSYKGGRPKKSVD